MTAASSAPAHELDPELVRAVPKVELHVHLEGTMEAEVIAELAAEVGEPLPRPVAELFSADGLSDFLGFLDWSCGLVRTPEMAARVAYDYASRAARDGIRYAEVIVNPTHWPGLSLDDLVDGIGSGFDRAAADGLAECNLLLSLLRTQGTEDGLDLVRWMIDRRPARLVGLSIDGNEAVSGRTGTTFAPAYRDAAAAGFGLVAHAGESSGPEGVRDALDLLGVHRIDHGVRAIEDPELIARLVRDQVPLNVCLTSNSYLLYRDLDEHPLPDLVAAGVAVTINTDDPAFLRCDLTGEMVLAGRLLAWDLADLVEVGRRAVHASFAPDEVRSRLLSELDEFETHMIRTSDPR